MKKSIVPSATFVILLAVVLACGTGGGSRTTTERIRADEGGTVTSADGALMLEIPPGALAEDTRISIQEVDPGDLPDDFSNLGEGPVYELTPAGLTFSESVTVSLSLDPVSLESSNGEGYDVYVLFTWSEALGLEPLDEPVMEIMRSEGQATIQGELDHFSHLSRTKSGMTVSLDEVRREQPVGGSFTAEVVVENTARAENPLLTPVHGSFHAYGHVELVGSGNFMAPAPLEFSQTFSQVGNFQCQTSPGIGSYGVQVQAISIFDPGGVPSGEAVSIVLDSVVECVAAPSATQPPVTAGDAVDRVLGEMGYTPEQITQLKIARVLDPTGDWIYSIFGVTPGQLREYLDLLWWFGLISETDRAALEFWFNLSLFECGEMSDGWLTVCGLTAGDFPEGDMLMFAAMFDGEIPLDDPNTFYTYAVVMDSDGDPSNNFTYMPPYDWDYYQGTDRWYELVWDPTMSSWDLYLVGENFADIHTDARAVIAENAVIFFIPASEVALERPAFRMTAFGHDGTFAPDASGGDVTGDDPSQPLSEITGDKLPAPE